MFMNACMSAKALMWTCAPRALAAGRTWLGTFPSDKAGNMGMIFAMMLVPTTAAIGMAVDYSRAFSNKHTVQQVLDGAVLSGGRVMDGGGGTQNSIQAARDYFNRSLPEHIDAQIERVAVNDEGKVEMTAHIEIETYFLKLVGHPKIDVAVQAESTPEDGGGKEVEMAVVFDVTGSMGSGAGSKMEVAKLAAKDLIDIMIPEGDTTGTTRISLVPFSQTVNVGSEFASAVTGEPASRTVTENDGWTRRCEKWRGGRLRDSWERDYDSQSDWDPDDDRTGRDWSCWWIEKTRTVTYYLKSCMIERFESVAGDAAYDETPPTGPGTNFRAFWTTNPASVTSCTPTKTLMPLTSDRDALRAKVDTFSSSGGTAGHIGTAWGWYTISPLWAGIWPEASEPKEYDATKRMKALVIMTDGDYNHQYKLDGTYGVGANGSSQSQAAQICEEAKEAGVEVFAIGVQISSAAREFLQECVSDPNHLIAVHYYDALTAEQVRPAFQAIAESVASATGTGSFRLRLTR